MQPQGSLANLLAWRYHQRPDFNLLWVGGTGPWTLGRLAEEAAAISARLAAAEIGPADRVLLRLGNDERFLPALMAVWHRQAVAVTMHPGTPPALSAEIAADIGTDATLRASGDDAAAAGPGPAISLDPVDPRPGQPVAFDVPAISGSEPAVVLLTSGSTGRPKGVTLSHDNLWANLRATVSSFQRDPALQPIPDTPRTPNLIANPLSHTGGILRLLVALYVGRPIVLLRKFDAQAAKAAIDRHGINNLTINPSMMRMLLTGLPEGANLGTVRYVSSGTAPLPPALREHFEARFGVPVIQSYGQTETAGAIAIESARDVLAGRRRPGSVGKPLAGMEIQILDAHNRPLDPGQEGSIVVRSAANTVGYLGSGAASAPAAGTEGWLDTGDLGYLDSDGYLYVTGRKKSLIICGGFNIVPEEVEAALIDQQLVTDAVVVALPDERLGEIPVALAESSDDPLRILERAKGRLAPYKRPRRLFIVPALPRLPIGKVDRVAATKLAEQLAGAEAPGH